MTHAEIVAAAAAHVEKPGLAQTDGIFRAGAKEGFVDGATWAHARLDSEIMRLRSENERLAAETRRSFEQAAALQAENGVLRGQIEEMKQHK